MKIVFINTTSLLNPHVIEYLFETNNFVYFFYGMKELEHFVNKYVNL